MIPSGFPIQVNIPVLPTVSAKVTFTDFNWAEGEVCKVLLFLCALQLVCNFLNLKFQGEST